MYLGSKFTMDNYTIDPDGNSIHIYVEGEGPDFVEWSKLLHNKDMDEEEIHDVAGLLTNEDYKVHAPLFPHQVEDLIEELEQALDTFEESERCYYPE